MAVVAPVDRVILLLRDRRVILDADLARLYGVRTKALIQAVKRNLARFPADFMFQLTREESNSLRSQSVTLKTGRGAHRKYRPYAFTQEGVAMLSSVLRSQQAINANIVIMRSFVRLRTMLTTNADLAKKLDALERKYDAQFKVVFDAMRALMEPLHAEGRRIGFRPKSETFQTAPGPRR